MQLILLSGPRRGEKIEITGRTSLGRHPDATITLDDRKVSRMHAVIEPVPDGGGWVIRDLDSTNLTYLNSEPIATAVLKESDVIRIGSTEIAIETNSVGDEEDPSSLTLEVSPQKLESLLRDPVREGPRGISEAIYRITTGVTTELTPQQVIERALPVVEQLIPFSSWAWLEWKEGCDQNHSILARSRDASVTGHLSRSLISRAIRHQRGMVSSEVGRDFEVSMADHGVATSSAMVIPLSSQRDAAQALYLERRLPHPKFEATDLETVAVLASVIGTAVDNAQLFQELKVAYDNLDTYLGQLNKSEKLASIGRLASSFAHDLNNPLSSLMGFLELAQRYVAKEIDDAHREKLSGFLEKVHDAADFCRGLSRNVLSFAREAPYEPVTDKPFSVARTVATTLAICDSSLKRSGARIEVDIPDDIVLSGDPSALQQIVMNLVTNASDAIKDAKIESGRIEIRARADEFGVVALEVTDNGPGIPEKIRQRVFEPLFTTKGEARGTGLGLYVISSIVTDAGGSLDFQTEVGHGTTFRVRVPKRLHPLGADTAMVQGAATPQQPVV